MAYKNPCDTASAYQLYIHIRHILMLPKFETDHMVQQKQISRYLCMALFMGSKTVLNDFMVGFDLLPTCCSPFFILMQPIRQCTNDIS
jgi:hypothetical protein